MSVTTDLIMLVYSAVLALVLILPYGTGRSLTWSVADAMGNRESPPPVKPWVARAERAHRNLLESLPVFAILVLVAHVTGQANETTALGATLFFWARVAHAILYIAGIAWLRTLAWVVAVIGMIVILVQIL